MTHGDGIRTPGTALGDEQRHPAPPGGGDITAELVQTDRWSDEMIAHAEIPVVDAPFVAVGGGIGSFVTADILRIAGVPTSSIRALGSIDVPWQTDHYLRAFRRSRASACARTPGRRRAVSGGFPATASERRSMKPADKFAAPLWRALTEPIFTDY